MITILKEPHFISPVYNPIIFELYSSLNKTIYFKVTTKHVNNSVISVNKIFIPPNGTRTSFIDLSKSLQSYVTTEIINNNEVFENTNSDLKFFIEVEEVDTSGKVLGEKYTSGVYTVYNARLNKFDVFNDKLDSYYMSSNKLSDYLTDKPIVSRISRSSKEFLYFLGDRDSGIKSVRLEVFKLGANTRVIDIPFSHANESVHRLDISPNTLYSTYNLEGIDKFTVTLLNQLDEVMSTKRVYIVEDYKSNQDLVKLLWENNLGGTTSFTFIAPKESKNSTKTSITRNGYLSKDNGVYSSGTEVIGMVSKSTYTVSSNPLTDDEYRYITDIIHSKNVYVVLNDDSLYPIQLTTNTLDVLSKKYSKTLNRIQLSFESDSNLKLSDFSSTDGFDYTLDINDL